MVETFAGRFQSDLTLLYAVEPIRGGSANSYAGAPSDKEVLASFMADELKHFDVHRVLLAGDPATEIVNYAHQGNFDLIMLPTHGYGRFRRFILGSVAAKVLHDALCPVWTSAHLENIPPLEEIDFHTVVCAIDILREPCPILTWAAKFAEEVGAELTIAHAVPTAKDVPDFYTDPDLKYDLLNQAREKIEQLQKSLGIEAKIALAADEVPAGVSACVERAKADMLVIGRTVHNGFAGRLRTNAYSIIRQSSCPVVSI
jgi:nucleotide-binding universal stress UspA family protein